ncbi:hypothetical protein [Duganella violaceipulchra]|uniref:Uncharacterized protein n=1 Tax=Duganella violaceipulchra TaxID=2849652 RepID=A0AA41H998_9BURK|nr:hypothetical protein [Duganella violaceicalia]MBV6323040.1 hypothetical protein [Duganella violaceicalia]MCP2010174.1 hypothetical protein [Duganella violaceicalia]
MNSYVFAVSNNPITAVYASLEAMNQNCEEYFQVVLENNDELRTLMDLLGVERLPMTMLSSNVDFASVFDYSAYLLPQLSKDNFDAFYDEWLRRTGRETSMDEYGQLIFLQGRGDLWNKMKYRFVLCETYTY